MCVCVCVRLLTIFSSFVVEAEERCEDELGGEAPSPWTTPSPPRPASGMDGEDNDADGIYFFNS